MGAYSFKKRFVPFVEDGSKTHTIRGKRKHPDKPGSTFHGFYAMRTKQCRKIIEAPVLRVEDIVIDPPCCEIWVAETKLNLDECDALAWRDGFRYPVDDTFLSHGPGGPVGGEFGMMLLFWAQENEAFTRWNGDIIHWDYSRRVKQ
jgi:hypothetical protein